MGRYLIRRSLFLILVLVVISFLTFLIFIKLPPGDPARRAVGPRRATPDLIAQARTQLGLDESFWVQYGRFAKGLVPYPSWFLNEEVYFSYQNFVPVKEEIFERLPVSVTVALG